jgi:hypothetical protein
VALLNDLFGIQARGGCSCAGPYGHRLLRIDMDRSMRFRKAITSGCEGIKPGWVRVNFNYFISEVVFRYILDAVHLVAEAGWRLLPYYRFSVDSGLWRHRDSQPSPEFGLDSLSFESGNLEYRAGERPRRVSRRCPSHHRRGGKRVRERRGFSDFAGRPGASAMVSLTGGLVGRQRLDMTGR